MSAIGFAGLGAMGSRLARRAIDAGHEVVVWNRTAEKAEPLVAAGARRAATPAEAAAAADVVITMVRDPQALAEVTEGPQGIAAGAQDGLTAIEMSTVGPEAVARLRSALPSTVALVDAPVLGSISEAQSGSLLVFAGGAEPDVQRCTPLLSAFGRVLHVGPLGLGAAAKLVANLTLFTTLGSLGEALALADGLGLSRETAFEILASTPLAAQAERRRPAFESHDYPRRFALSLARKDADLVAGAAAKAGVELKVAEGARSWLAAAEDAGWGDRDYSAALETILRRPEPAVAEPPGLRIRHARPDDYAEVIGVIDDWWGGRTMAPMLPKLFFVHFEQTSFVAERDGRIAGFLCGFLSQTHRREAYVHFAGVDPAERGSGLGRALYERFFAAARAAGRSIVRCVTSPVNEASVAFHRRLGFEVERIDESYDGRGEARVLMRIEL